MDTAAKADAMFRYPRPTDEDLPALSRLAYNISARECGACRNYHVKFPYLRSIDANGNGAEHGWAISRGTIREVFKAGVASRTDARWLIAGVADAGVPALVRSCCLDFPDWKHTVTVVDRCGTPLALSRAYAVAVGWSIDCVKSDLLTFSRAAEFDIVLFHYTMGFFDEEGQVELLRKTRQWLAPGGQIIAFVYYNRDDFDGAASRQTKARWQRSMVERAVEEGELSLPEDLETFLWRLENSRDPARSKRRRRSLEDLKTLVLNGGFAITKLVDLPATKEEVGATGSEPTPNSIIVAKAD